MRAVYPRNCREHRARAGSGIGAVREARSLIYHPGMRTRHALPCAVALLAAPLLAGCGASAYTPRPSPRLAVTTDDGSMVLTKNGRKYPFGPFGGEIEEAVQGVPRAEEEARSYKSKLVTGFVLSTIGAVSAGVGAGILVDNELQPTPSTPVEIGSVTALVGGLVLSIVGGVVSGSAQPHLWNAINIYNDSLPPAYPMYPAWPQRPAYPGYPAAPGYAPPAYAPPRAAAPGYAPPSYTPPAGATPSYAPAAPTAPVPPPAATSAPPPR